MPVPAWLPLLAIAAYVSCFAMAAPEPYEDQDDEDVFGYDFSQGYTSLEGRVDSPPQRKPGVIQVWLARRRAEREERRVQIEQEEERQVDGILERLHDYGIDALSPQERAVLNRVAARYRARSED